MDSRTNNELLAAVNEWGESDFSKLRELIAAEQAVDVLHEALLAAIAKGKKETVRLLFKDTRIQIEKGDEVHNALKESNHFTDGQRCQLALLYKETHIQLKNAPSIYKNLLQAVTDYASELGITQAEYDGRNTSPFPGMNSYNDASIVADVSHLMAGGQKNVKKGIVLALMDQCGISMQTAHAQTVNKHDKAVNSITYQGSDNPAQALEKLAAFSEKYQNAMEILKMRRHSPTSFFWQCLDKVRSWVKANAQKTTMGIKSAKLFTAVAHAREQHENPHERPEQKRGRWSRRK